MININEYEYDGSVDYDQEKNRIWVTISIDNSDIDNAVDIVTDRENLQNISQGENHYYGYDDIFILNIIRKYDTEQVPSVETGKSDIILGLKQPSFGSEQYNALLAQIEELENCILEMSEIIYGDEGDAV